MCVQSVRTTTLEVPETAAAQIPLLCVQLIKAILGSPARVSGALRGSLAGLIADKYNYSRAVLCQYLQLNSETRVVLIDDHTCGHGCTCCATLMSPPQLSSSFVVCCAECQNDQVGGALDSGCSEDIPLCSAPDGQFGAVCSSECCSHSLVCIAARDKHHHDVCH